MYVHSLSNSLLLQVPYLHPQLELDYGSTNTPPAPEGEDHPLMANPNLGMQLTMVHVEAQILLSLACLRYL